MSAVSEVSVMAVSNVINASSEDSPVFSPAVRLERDLPTLHKQGKYSPSLPAASVAPDSRKIRPTDTDKSQKDKVNVVFAWESNLPRSLLAWLVGI